MLKDILLAKIVGGGGGPSVTVEPLSVTANGTYTAEEGKAYSPVTANVPQAEPIEVTTALSKGRYHLAATNIGNYALFGGGVTLSAEANTVDAISYTL